MKLTPIKNSPTLALALAILLTAIAFAPAQDNPPPASQPAPPPLSTPAGQSPATRLGTVYVTAQQQDTRSAIEPSLGAVTYSMTSDQIKNIPGGPDVPFQQILVRSAPVVREVYGGVHVRSEDGNLTYRLNGILLPEGLNVFGQEIDTRIVNNVNLIVGTLPAQYGFRTDGIVDITTKTGQDLQGGDLSLYGGGYDTINPSFEFGGANNNLDYFVTGSFNHNSLGIENPLPQSRAIHDDTNQAKLFSYTSASLNPNDRLTLLLNASYATFQLPNTPNLPPAYSLMGKPPVSSSSTNERQTEQNYYAVVSLQHQSPKFSCQASAFTTFGQIRYSPDYLNDLIFSGLATKITNNFLTNGLQFDSTFLADNHHTLRAGAIAEYTAEKLNTANLAFPADTNGNQLSNVPISIVDNRNDWGLSAGLYLQDEWALTKFLTLNYGARFDRFHSSFVSGSQLSPRFNAVYKLSPAASLHAGYARYFSPPTVRFVPPATIQKFANTTATPDNFIDDPIPIERSHYFDAGINTQLAPGLNLTLDGFYKRAKNLVNTGQFGDALIFSQFSNKTANVFGGELAASYDAGPLSTYLNLGYVKTSAKTVNSSQFEFDNDELAFAADHAEPIDDDGRASASIGFSYNWPRDHVYLDATYGYGLRSGFVNTKKEPSYFPVNLGYSHEFPINSKGVKSIELHLDLINAFDESYQLHDGTGLGIAASQYGQRRTLLGGLTFNF